MAAEAIVHHQLDLVIRLIDSITGREVSERNIQFFLNPNRGAPIARGGGTYLFLGIGREDFTLEVHVYGYESRTVKISFGELDQNVPIQEIYLLPKDYPVRGREILTLRGKLPGIQAIEAVSLTGADCYVREYDGKGRIMTVLNQHSVKLSSIWYGLIAQDRTGYERFEIEEEVSSKRFRLKKKLEQEPAINQPVARIIFGQVEEDGTYLLKVHDSSTPQYLVRCVTEDRVMFQQVDFHSPEGLSKGGRGWE